MTPTRATKKLPSVIKVPSGINGLDEILDGGLPQGRPTLVYGGAGSGKTLMGMEFLVRGATQFNEPGVFMSFEETEEDLATNVGSLGFDLKALSASGKISIDYYVSVERSEIEETGEYDLEGLFVRINSAVEAVHAKRIVLDTIEVLFSGLNNTGVIRAELRRLFRWLKSKGLTTIITGERGEGSQTRHNLEEYVSDCVIFLDNRVNEELSTRRLRIVKYRGSPSSTNEFPFIVDESGIHVMPVTEVKLEYPASTERVSSGVAELDRMLDGKGFIKGSCILVSGMVGTGKSSLSASFVQAGCRSGKRALYFAFEEAPSQIMRNMSSIGINLERCVDKGLLRFDATRTPERGLEKHLFTMQQAISDFKPELVVVDAINDFTTLGGALEVRQMVLRLMDFFKQRQITALSTSMASPNDLEETGVGLSSAFDTWIHLANVQGNLERNRTLVVVKSRGMPHSNQVREFLLTNKGVKLVDIYLSPAGVFMGSARLAQEAVDEAADIGRRNEVAYRERQLEEKRAAMEARISSLRADFEAETKDVEILLAQERARQKAFDAQRKSAAEHRGAVKDSGKGGGLA